MCSYYCPYLLPPTPRIVIKDKNDNPPYFPQQHYTAEVPEDADIGSKVLLILLLYLLLLFLIRCPLELLPMLLLLLLFLLLPQVIEVVAEDLDTEASVTTYSITNGNLGFTFEIEPQTGFIKVGSSCPCPYYCPYSCPCP